MELVLPEMPTPAGLPALFAGDQKTASSVIEFFAAQLRNAHTRRAYARAALEFSNWCGEEGIHELRHVGALHVAAYIEQLLPRLATPSIKLQLAALRALFDWLVVKQALPVDPAASVRGPRYSSHRGKTPVLTREQSRALFDSFNPGSIIDLRDRALVALMTYVFARVSAALKLRRKDIYGQGNRLRVRLQEKGGKEHNMPCNTDLERYLREYIEALTALTGSDGEACLFPTAPGRRRKLSGRSMSKPDAY